MISAVTAAGTSMQAARCNQAGKPDSSLRLAHRISSEARQASSTTMAASMKDRMAAPSVCACARMATMTAPLTVSKVRRITPRLQQSGRTDTGAAAGMMADMGLRGRGNPV